MTDRSATARTAAQRAAEDAARQVAWEKADPSESGAAAKSMIVAMVENQGDRAQAIWRAHGVALLRWEGANAKDSDITGGCQSVLEAALRYRRGAWVETLLSAMPGRELKNRPWVSIAVSGPMDIGHWDKIDGAQREGHSVVSKLLERVDAREYGENDLTPLLTAAFNGDDKMVEILAPHSDVFAFSRDKKRVGSALGMALNANVLGWGQSGQGEYLAFERLMAFHGNSKRSQKCVDRALANAIPFWKKSGDQKAHFEKAVASLLAQASSRGRLEATRVAQEEGFDRFGELLAKTEAQELGEVAQTRNSLCANNAPTPTPSRRL